MSDAPYNKWHLQVNFPTLKSIAVISVTSRTAFGHELFVKMIFLEKSYPPFRTSPFAWRVALEENYQPPASTI
jgi:hypothetical protein